MATLVAGATGGFVVGVSSVGRHLALAHAPLEHELRGMADDTELGQLLGRAADAYRDAVKAIGGEAPAARDAADELVGKMTRFGRRWRELELEAARVAPGGSEGAAPARRPPARGSTNDPLARAELARAREALAAQLAYVDEIRERPRARARPARAPGGDARAAAAGRRCAIRSADAARLGAELAAGRRGAGPAGGDFDIAAEALTEATVAGALPAAARN